MDVKSFENLTAIPIIIKQLEAIDGKLDLNIERKGG